MPALIGRWAPVVLWMGAVFFFSSLSHLGRLGRTPDWISHPLEYAAGGMLVCRALRSDRLERTGTGPRARTDTGTDAGTTTGTATGTNAGRGAFSLRAAVAATLLTTAYGITDEYHQAFVPGRTADPTDVVKDFVGAAAAALLYHQWTRAVSGTLSPEPPQ